jgi:phenylalanyl-tRNA synthetase beta chain
MRPLARRIAEYLGLPDASIEIKLTPNRADCFSVRGIAFDVAAACGSEVKPFDATPVPAQSDRRDWPSRWMRGAKRRAIVGRVIEGVNACRPRRCGWRSACAAAACARCRCWWTSPST